MSTEDSGISKSQLDKLGSRLRNDAHPTDEDLVLLDRYRERFKTINETVISELRELTDLAIEWRQKSIPSIVAKLRRRQPARLAAIQDIAGARVIVADLSAQDDLVAKIIERFRDASTDDKRLRASFSYRAVHVVVRFPLPYEIQIRTQRQHIWAQLSERLADRYGFELKYGGGPQDVAYALEQYSEFLSAADRLEAHAEDGRDARVIGDILSYVEQLRAIMEVLAIE